MTLTVVTSPSTEVSSWVYLMIKLAVFKKPAVVCVSEGQSIR